MMRFHKIGCFVLLWIFGCICWAAGNRVNADVLWLKDTDGPVWGEVQSQDSELVKMRCLVDGQWQVIEFKRTEVRDLMITVDPEKLESLDPDNLEPYLDYAEQLSAFRSDEYAMRVARRLCLIVARWGQQELRSSAFRLLVSMSDGAEKQKFERLAFVYDSTFEIQVQPSQRRGFDPEARKSVIEIIRFIRRAELVQARLRFAQEEVQLEVRPVLEYYSEICNLAEFKAAIQASQISLTQLTQLLRLERALLSSTPASELKRKGAGRNWGASAQQIVADQLELPEFEGISPDPRLTVYRQGRWVAPN